jgi:hypothetical protein
MACIEGMHMKHGKPTMTAAETATGNPRGPGPVASVAERLVVAWKPGNAGGAKGPHFGRVGGRDKGIAIGFGLATQKNPSILEATVRSGEGCAAGAIVGLTVKPVGEPDAGNPPVRFDEREVETEHGMRLLRHRQGKPRNRICRNLPHRATSRLYPFLAPFLALICGRGISDALYVTPDANRKQGQLVVAPSLALRA